MWSLKLESLNWEILSNDFLIKVLDLFKEYGTNNLLHIKLTSLLKNIFSFLLKESESYSDSISNKHTENMLPQMSTISPPNNDSSSKAFTAKKAAWILGEGLKSLHENLVCFLMKLNNKQKNKFLFKGFVIQICRLVLPFDKRGHRIVKNNSHWKQVYYDFLFQEMKKEDRILVEDPKNKNSLFNDHIGLPPNFKINNASLQGKMNLQSNYDSLGNQGMILEDNDDEEESPKQNVLEDLNKHHRDSDSDSDSESDSDEELLQNYSFGRSGGILGPKILQKEDQDFSGYDSGVGKGVDLTQEIEKEFTKSDTPEMDLYKSVNDWNIYGQGSWKALGEDLQQVDSQRKYTSLKNVKSEVVNNLNEDKDSDNLQRHQITRSENKKYGLYGSLTRRFQIKNKNDSNKKNSNIKLEKYYNSGNLVNKNVER